jgi:hypothetical protein
MATTIQVKEKNLKLLEELKRATAARSYDEVLGKLLKEKLKVPESMFGVDRGKLTPFTEADRLEARE